MPRHTAHFAIDSTGGAKTDEQQFCLWQKQGRSDGFRLPSHVPPSWAGEVSICRANGFDSAFTRIVFSFQLACHVQVSHTDRLTTTSPVATHYFVYVCTSRRGCNGSVRSESRSPSQTLNTASGTLTHHIQASQSELVLASRNACDYSSNLGAVA